MKFVTNFSGETPVKSLIDNCRGNLYIPSVIKGKCNN